MTNAERQLWLNYSSTVSHIHHLQKFLKSLYQLKVSQADALKAYDDIVAGVKKNILLVTHHILQDNSFARKKLKQACINLDCAVDQLRDAIVVKTVSNENKKIFKTKEVYDLVRCQYFALKKEYEKTLDLKFDLQQKICFYMEL